MFNFKNKKFGNLYEFLIVLTVGILVINLYAYFPNSKAIYALTKVDETSLENQATSFAKDSIIRDYKIPDEIASEDTELLLPEFDSNKKNTDTIGNNFFKGKKLIVIDPGHGGIDPGTGILGIDEKDISLDIAMKTNSLLTKTGVTTLLTRDDDTYVALRERINLANTNNAVLFLSIHCNSFTDPLLKGTMTLYNPSVTLSSGGLFEKEYAQIIQDELVQYLGSVDLGLADRPNLAVLHHAEMPAVIVELGFLTNKADAKLLSSEVYRQKCAEALVKGILKALKKIG